MDVTKVVRIMVEFNEKDITLEQINTIVENLKRNLYPKPREVYFQVVDKEEEQRMKEFINSMFWDDE